MAEFPLWECPVGNLTDRYQLIQFSLALDLNAQTVSILRTDLGGHTAVHRRPVTELDDFTHLEPSINSFIPSYLLNVCEITIPCLLKSRERFDLNDFYLTNHFKRRASLQTNCWNRKKCVIFISLVNCTYDMTSCPVSFTTYLDRHRGQTSRKVSFRWLQWW